MSDMKDDQWTLTASGKKLVYLKPEVGDICIEDIAQHLSQICRFTGATSQFYSVAQHSILVAQLVQERLSRWSDKETVVGYWDQVLGAILHDAEEAYMQDLASPLKATIGGRYKLIAHGISLKIFERFEVDWCYHGSLVKSCDTTACEIERYYLMPDHPDWPKVSESAMAHPQPRLLEHENARIQFLDIFHTVLKIRNMLRHKDA